MLNPFPIQFLAILAYTILRVFIGSLLIYFGISHVNKRTKLKETFAFPTKRLAVPFLVLFILTEFIAGAMLLVGLYTQVAALIVICMSLKIIIFHKRFVGTHIQGRLFYLLLLVSAVSLFITGAGAFAFDLPI